MFATMARFEFMNIIRERMTAVMLLWPLVIGGLAKYAIHRGIVEGQAAAVIAMFMTLVAGHIFGAMAGFSLLDDRDDQVFASIQISPVSLRLYIWFKICFVWALAVLAGFLIIWLVGIAGMAIVEVLSVSLLSALQVPIVAFLVNSFAKNKVEGFVTMKASGFLLMFPIGGFFFLDAREWLFALAPAHWAAKAVQYVMLRPLVEAGFVSMNLNFYQYIGLGMLYNLVLIAAVYKFFLKKNEF